MTFSEYFAVGSFHSDCDLACLSQKKDSPFLYLEVLPHGGVRETGVLFFLGCFLTDTQLHGIFGVVFSVIKFIIFQSTNSNG